MSENTETVKAAYAAFARGDVPHVLGILHPECVWTEAENFIYADQNPYVGHQAILTGVFGRLAAEWEDFSVNPERFITEGDTVVALVRYRGTLKATGVKVNAQCVHVFTIKAGKVMAFEQFTDTAQFRDAVAGRAARVGS